MSNINIFVANLNFNTTEDDLMDLFGEYGEVEKVKIVQDRDSGKSKGFGFVEMANEEDGLAAIKELNEAEFDEREIVVKKAIPRENNRGGGGGGYRGRNNNRGGGGYGGGGYGGGRNNNRGGGGYGGGGGYSNNRY